MLTVAGKVRDIMGTDDELSISDPQIMTLIGIAEKRIRKEVFTYKEDVTPSNDPDTGNSWNGSNTSFTLGEPIMDYDFDESTVDDVTGYWWDSNNNPYTASVVVSDARYGRITVKQNDATTPIPTSANKVLMSYYTCDENIPFEVLEELGTLLTAHFIMLRLTETKKISNADLESNKALLTIRTTAYSKEYQRLLRDYAEPELIST